MSIHIISDMYTFVQSGTQIYFQLFKIIIYQDIVYILVSTYMHIYSTHEIKDIYKLHIYYLLTSIYPYIIIYCLNSYINFYIQVNRKKHTHT